MRSGARIGIALTVALTLAVGPSQGATDRREMQAREAFAAGRYQDALDLFAKLYAEKLHPNYLRNIARCYQNLGDPDKAIGSFREYLRKAKSVQADERQEIEGYIKEMEDLKRQRQAEAATPPPSGAAPAAHPLPVPMPLAPAPAAGTSEVGAGPEGAMLARTPGPVPAAQPSSPVYTRWWFWTIVAAGVAAGAGTAAALGAFTKTQDAACVPPCK